MAAQLWCYLGEVVDQNGHSLEYVEATIMPLAIRLHRDRNRLEFNSEVSREFRRAQEEKSNE